MESIGAFELLVIVIVAGIAVLPIWRIVSKAGFPGVLSLLFLIPMVNIIMLFVFAFMKWPIERELEKIKAARQ